MAPENLNLVVWSRWMCLAACVLAAAWLAPAAHSQVLYGSLVGTVEDSTGAVIPGATVTLVSAGTGQERQTTSDAAGRYSIGNLLPGSYELRLTATGFRTLSRTNIPISINTVIREDVKLEVGGVTEQVTVAASALRLQTETADVHVELGSRELTDLPLAKYRNYQTLINLVPGATPGRFQNTNIPMKALTTNVNGVNRNNNATKLDGTPDRFTWLPHHTLYVPPAETVET
jgi:hypothetical protein